MKSKTSITLSQDLLAEIDRLAGPEGTRSALIERVLRAFVRRRRRHHADSRDLELLNRHAARLNAEAADVLTYQASWPESAEG
jgi:metal-responsive CopG/Arc/MetJ family transcriptional regulator